MCTTEKRYDLTSADSKIVGFDYQYFFFMDKLLQLQKDQSIGFEIKDDIHIDICTNSRKTLKLYQLKHTIQKNAAGKNINLTDLDIDLWKTLYNWIKVISDGDRTTMSNQKDFLNTTEFIFVTNKNISNSTLVSKIHSYTSETSKYNELISCIKNIDTSNQEIKKYIKEVLKQKQTILKLFFGKITFIDTGENIIESIKESIRFYMIPPTRVNDVFNDLFSELKLSFFNSVLKNQHQEITYENFHKHYISLFEKHRATFLSVRRFEPIIRENIFDMPFIQELVEIGEITNKDLVEATEFATFLLEIEMNLEKWLDDGEITRLDIENLNYETFNHWKIKHKKNHRKSTLDLQEDYINALNCLDDIRSLELSVLQTTLGITLSNGKFYSLANDEKIGWKLKWKENY